MKKLLPLICVILAALLLCGCAPKAQPAETPAPTPEVVEATAEPNPEPTAEPEEDSEAIYVRFSTETIDGEPVDESIFNGHRLIILNFWEPWCGPCVSEMPDLQKVYENYSDDGFLMIGVYSTEEGAAKAVAETGVKYPIIKNTAELQPFMTEYVPTSIVVDGNGRFLDGPYIGSGRYDDWASVVEAMLR